MAQKINAPATTGHSNIYSIMFAFIASCLQITQIRTHTTVKCSSLCGLRNWAFHLEEGTYEGKECWVEHVDQIIYFLHRHAKDDELGKYGKTSDRWNMNKDCSLGTWREERKRGDIIIFLKEKYIAM